MKYIPKNSEERREEAFQYLVKKYYESKMREEESRKRLESYGRFRRWIYKRTKNFKIAGMIVKEIVIKPVGLALMVVSGWFSSVLTIFISPKVIEFIDSIVPSPYNQVVGVVAMFPIGFSPIIIAVVSYAYYVNREIKKRLKEDYGIEI